MKPDFIILSERERLKPFRKYIGKELSEISCWRLFCDGEPDTECDCNLDLLFRDESVLSMSIKEDGQSIEADPRAFNKPVWAVSDDVNRYVWQRLMLTKNQPWAKLVGQQLAQIDSIILQWTERRQEQEIRHEALAGCRCVFENNNYLVFTNRGDQAEWFFNQMPYESELANGEMCLDSL